MKTTYLVRLEEGLDRSRRAGIFCAIKTIPGVELIVDRAAITGETEDVILLKPTERLRRADPTIFNAIRRYWQRRRQPGLDLG